MSRRNSGSSIAWLPLGLLVCVLSGCGKGGPALVEVEGSVNVDGKPTEGVNLIFFPKDKALKLIPSATSDANGKFKLATDARNGVPAGSYDITATYPDPAVKPTESQRMQGLGDPGPDLFNGKYVKKDTSGLKADITAGSKTLPPLELTRN